MQKAVSEVYNDKPFNMLNIPYDRIINKFNALKSNKFIKISDNKGIRSRIKKRVHYVSKIS